MSFSKDLIPPHHLFKDIAFLIQNFSLHGLESLPKHMLPFLMWTIDPNCEPKPNP